MKDSYRKFLLQLVLIIVSTTFFLTEFVVDLIFDTVVYIGFACSLMFSVIYIMLKDNNYFN